MFIEFLLLFVFFIASQAMAKTTTTFLYKEITKTAKEMSERSLDDKLKNEYQILDHLDDKRKKLWFITTIIGFLEFILFTLATIYIFSEFQTENYNIFKEFALVFGGWFAIKIIGNYGQWSGAYFGRAAFYTFLIGTIINVLGAYILGWLLSTAF